MTVYSIAGATIALGLLTIAPAHAASFDCAKAGTMIEKAICGDPALSDLDSQLAQAYKGALATTSNKDGLKAEQKAWLAQRNQCQTPTCLTSAYQTRLNTLQGKSNLTAMTGTGTGTGTATSGITGTYLVQKGDIFSSEVKVLQTNNATIRFSVSAVYRMNTGELSGEAALQGNHATYSSTEYGECSLVLTFGSHKLDVIQTGDCGMGMNVSSTGSYKQTSSAPPTIEEN